MNPTFARARRGRRTAVTVERVVASDPHDDENGDQKERPRDQHRDIGFGQRPEQIESALLLGFGVLAVVLILSLEERRESLPALEDADEVLAELAELRAGRAPPHRLEGGDDVGAERVHAPERNRKLRGGLAVGVLLIGDDADDHRERHAAPRERVDKSDQRG